MNIIKAKNWKDIPNNFTGIVEWDNEDLEWFKDNRQHREDGFSYKSYNNDHYHWALNGIVLFCTNTGKIDLRNKIILSKEQHPLYSTVQVWKYLNENWIQEQIVIPGMEEYIIE